MDYRQRAEEWIINGRSAAFDDRHMAALCDLLSANAAAMLALGDQLKSINDDLDLLRQAVEVLHEMGEPLDDHPADLVERHSGCGEDAEQHEAGRCPLCQQTWAECQCTPRDYHKALK